MNKAKQLTKLRKKAFKLWSERVRSIGCCEHCGIKYKEMTPKGKPAILNAHHIIGRENKALAWDLQNGLSLCQYCHKWSRTGPHRGSIIFSEWFRQKYPTRYQYLLEGWNKEIEITVEYMETIVKGLTYC